MTRVIKDVFGNLCIFNFFILLWGYLYRDNKIEELVGSICVTVMHSALENVDAIVKLSDEALYKAKNSGRNIVVINKTEFLENYLYEDSYKDSNELNLVNSKICIC